MLAWIQRTLFAAVIATATSASATTIYVDANQTTNAPDGLTSATAWTNINDGVSHLATINQSSPGGHTVSIAEGTYTEAVELTTNHSGVAGSPNLFLGNGEVVVQVSGGAKCFYLNLAQYISLRKLNMTSSDNNGDGVYFAASGTYYYYFSMQDCRCSDLAYGVRYAQHYQRETTYTNCVFVRNRTGMYSTMTTGYRFDHCVFAYNGIGSRNRYGGTPGLRTYRNCVFLANSQAFMSDGTTVDTTFTNCIFYKNGLAPWQNDVDNGYVEDMESQLYNTGDLQTSDPAYVDAAGGDFQTVYAGSPCLADPTDPIGLTNVTSVALPSAETFYVNATGGDDTYTAAEAVNPNTPWLTITNALSHAGVGDTIRVAAGTYNEKLTISTKATEDRPLTLRADGQVIVDGTDYGIVLDAAANIIIDGFDVTGFSAAGVRLENYTYGCRISNVSCYNNPTAGNGIEWAGKLGRCHVDHSRFYQVTYGVNAWYSSTGFIFDSCDIYQTYRGLRISNTAQWFKNCNFYQSYQGSYHFSYGSPYFDNCNFVSNTSDGIYIAQACSIRARNCNIAFNPRGVSYYLNNLAAQNCNFHNSTNMLSNVPAEYQTAQEINDYGAGYTDNITVDPMFRDVDTMDFRLLLGSECIDGGTDVAFDTDYFGNPRLIGDAVDIGSYEFPPPIGIRSFPASGVGSTHATLNGQVIDVAGAENPYVYFCWGYTNAGTNHLADWEHADPQGTNWGTGQTFSTNLTGLLSDSNYTYACFASNSTGTAWSDAQEFRCSVLRIQSFPATDVGPTNATLSGEVIYAAGAENPSVYFCWGYTNGGTNSLTDWEHPDPQGTNWGTGQTFSTNLTGLLPGSTYTYVCFASNSAGTAWSDAQEFRCNGLEIQSLPASDVGTTNATLNGAVLDAAGAENPSVYFCWGYTNGGTNSLGDWEHADPQGTNWGVGQTFSTNLTGLLPGSTYTYVCFASSSAGTAWSAAQEFLTDSTDFTNVTYYVSDSIGDDSRTESQARNPATPWKTITNAVSRGLAVANAIVPGGHTISIAEGTYTEAVELTTAHSGVAGSPNLFLGNGEVVVQVSGGAKCFYLNLAKYISLRKLNMTSSDNNGDGVYFAASGTYSYYFSMQDCRCSDLAYGVRYAQHFQRETTYTNCVFVRNGTGMYSTMTTGYRFDHCVFAYNGIGSRNRYGGTPGLRTYRNCVFLANSQAFMSDGTTVDTTFTNCIFYKNGLAPWQNDVDNGYVEDMESQLYNTGGLQASDPAYVDAAAGAFQIVYAGSPCLADPTDPIGLTNVTSVALPSAETFHVNATGGDDTYTAAEAANPNTPWLTITNALSHAGVGDTIRVAAGTYSDKLTISTKATEDRPLTLRADGQVIVDGTDYGIVLDAAANIIIDGFDVTGFSTAGVRLENYTYGCRISNVSCYNNPTAGNGIEWAARLGRCHVDRSRFYQVTYGVSAWYSASGFIFDSCDMYLAYRALRIAGTVHWFKNCNFYQSYQGSYHFSYGSPYFDNCNFVSNTSDGIYIAQACSIRARNCNIAFNPRGVSYYLNNLAAQNCNFHNSTNMLSHLAVVYQTAQEINDFSAAYTNNITVDPMFQDVDTADFRLLLGSECIDGGTDVVFDTDYLGNPRLIGGAVDIGSYEWQPPAGTLISIR